MWRKIIGVIVGLSIAIILAFALISIPFISERLWLARLVVPHLPFLVGGIITGYIARRKGWIFGLLDATFFVGSLWISSIIHWYQVTDKYMYKALGYGGFANVTMVLLSITMFLTGATGGLFGQFLAQKWLRKKDK